MMRGVLRFLRQWQNVIGLLLVGVMVYVAIDVPRLAPPDPGKPEAYHVVGRSTDRSPHPPSEVAPWGTVSGQLDVRHSVLWGTRSALRFGLTVTVLTAVFGVLVGAISGYLGGWFNAVVMRITDAMLAFPVIAGVVLFEQIVVRPSVGQPPNAVYVFFDTLGLDPLMAALIAFSWMPYARLINANVLKIKQIDFILASKSLGVGTLRMVFKHIIPNTVSPALVLAARDVGVFVVLEAAFTFIGLGGGSEWGNLLAANRNWIIGIRGNPFTYWWVYIPPTIALIIFGVGWNLLGDGLNRVLNPRSHR